MSFGFLKSMH